MKKFLCAMFLGIFAVQSNIAKPVDDLYHILERAGMHLSITAASTFLHSPLGNAAIKTIKDEMRSLSLKEINEIRAQCVLDRDSFAQVESYLSHCTREELASIKQLASWLSDKLAEDMPRDARNLIYDVHNLLWFVIGKVEYPQMNNTEKIQFYYLAAKAYALSALRGGSLALKATLLGDKKKS